VHHHRRPHRCQPADLDVQRVCVQVEAISGLPPDQLTQRLLGLVVDELTQQGVCIVGVCIDVNGSPDSW